MKKIRSDENINDYIFLSNTHNPEDPHADQHIQLSYQVFFDYALAAREIKAYHDWVNANFIGPPEATEKYSQQELIDIGLVGLYAKKDNMGSN